MGYVYGTSTVAYYWTVSDNRRCRKFGKVPFWCAAYRAKGWSDSNGKNENYTSRTVGDHLAVSVLAFVITAKLWRTAWNRKTWKFCKQFLRFFKRSVSNCRYCADRAQNLPGPAPTFGSHCSRFHPNPFTFGGFIAVRVKTFFPVEYLQWAYKNSQVKVPVVPLGGRQVRHTTSHQARLLSKCYITLCGYFSERMSSP